MKNLASMLFMSELMGEVLKALREHRSVIELEYRRHGNQGAALQLELRVTRMGDLLLPPSRKPLSKSEFQARALRLNARDLKRSAQRVRPGRKAARDDGKGKKE